MANMQGYELARKGELLAGKVAVRDLSRLAAETVDGSGTVSWSIQGTMTRLRHPQLNLDVSADLRLACQRCLLPMSYALRSQASLVLTATEESADHIEALLEDESLDVIVLQEENDPLLLIEDEVLLNLPLAPVHDVCEAPAVAQETARSAFAVLKGLKESKS